MQQTESEAGAHRSLSNKTCPDCSSKMADFGDRFECLECKHTLMKDYNPF